MSSEMNLVSVQPLDLAIVLERAPAWPYRPQVRMTTACSGAVDNAACSPASRLMP